MASKDITPEQKAVGNAILDTTKRLYYTGMNPPTLAGNTSARAAPGSDLMVITPSALDKVNITIDQLAVMQISTEKLVAGPKQSSEYQVHTHIYNVLPEINAVVHPHPPYSLSIVSACGMDAIRELSKFEEEYKYYLGKVAIVKGPHGTVDLAKAVAEEAKKGALVIIMEDHGTVGIGKTMHEALSRVEALEHLAKKFYITENLRFARERE